MEASTLFNVNVILHLITVALVAVGTFVVATAKKAIETKVDLAVKNTNWPYELAHELEKTRGVERQQERLKSYAALWTKLRPLAVYEQGDIDAQSTGNLSETLTAWYFSDCGGLMLTKQIRQFYFALQDLLWGAARIPDWKAERAALDEREAFKSLLVNEHLDDAARTFERVRKIDSAEWNNEPLTLGDDWRREVKKLLSRWPSLSPVDRYVVLQQVGSVLRAAMANDVESRLR